MQTQTDPRFKKRVPCRLRVGGKLYSGMVLNVSRQGLFVQTSVVPPPGQDVSLDLNLTQRDAIPIGARVVWRRNVAPHMRTVTTGGIGVRIASAPEAYYDFLARVGGAPGSGDTTAPPHAAPEPARPAASESKRFRVRVKQSAGPRTRIVDVNEPSEDAARRKALAQCGSGWDVLDVSGDRRDES